ncbi:hypothetical protein BaRGS_00018731 [Batillaria attramentaria]|uniref:Uncharacterized protein n=1 Tax=Batillaria attramentaria TaxID=370345 RepID=A0ABD0KRZ0_9CAEN
MSRFRQYDDDDCPGADFGRRNIVSPFLGLTNSDSCALGFSDRPTDNNGSQHSRRAVRCPTSTRRDRRVATGRDTGRSQTALGTCTTNSTVPHCQRAAETSSQGNVAVAQCYVTERRVID